MRPRLALLAALLLALVGWKFVYLHPHLDSGAAPRGRRYGETGDGFDATGEDLEEGWREEFAKRLEAAKRAPPPPPQSKSICVKVSPDDGGFGRLAVAFKGDGAAMSVCEAKTRCRRMGKRCAGMVRIQDRTTFLTRDELFNAVQRSGNSATLFVALYGKNGDALRNALRSYDASGRLQMRAAAYAADGGAPVFRNTTTHDNTIYEVAHARSEFWLDLPNQKIATVDGGLCEAKAACARHKKCKSFVYRVRDGAAVLYAGSQIARPQAPQTVMRKNQQRNKAKTVRRIYRKSRAAGASGASASRRMVTSRAPATLNGQCVRRCELCWATGGPRSSGKPRVVVTLTTLPGRIHQIRKVLESLLQQTLSADEIRVYADALGAATRLRDAALARGHGAARALGEDREGLRPGDEGDSGC